ncbi:hypothetical protein J5275_29945 [Rhizobium sp. L245/93]|nr:hypothetical protein [Rhizobium sp. L245/93]
MSTLQSNSTAKRSWSVFEFQTFLGPREKAPSLIFLNRVATSEKLEGQLLDGGVLQNLRSATAHLSARSNEQHQKQDAGGKRPW